MSAVQLLVGVVVVTHGQLAVELVNAAEAIVGDMAHVQADPFRTCCRQRLDRSGGRRVALLDAMSGRNSICANA